MWKANKNIIRKKKECELARVMKIDFQRIMGVFWRNSKSKEEEQGVERGK